MDNYEESYLVYQQGLDHFENGEFQFSLECFLQSNELHEHSRTNARIYECLIKLGMSGEARPYIELAYKMNPNHDKVTMQYVDSLLQEGKFDMAKELLYKLLIRNNTYNPAKRLLEEIDT